MPCSSSVGQIQGFQRLDQRRTAEAAGADRAGGDVGPVAQRLGGIQHALLRLEAGYAAAFRARSAHG